MEGRLASKQASERASKQVGRQASKQASESLQIFIGRHVYTIIGRTICTRRRLVIGRINDRYAYVIAMGDYMRTFQEDATTEKNETRSCRADIDVRKSS